MDEWVTVLIAAAWLAVFAMLVYGVVSGWQRQLRADAPLPLYRLLAREGFTPARADAALGASELARAASRCAACASRTACETGVLGGWLGRRPAGCPNAALFDRLTDATEEVKP